jgi:Putative prokaryotic signal transducing protein
MMKLLFSSQNLAEVGLLQSRLEAAGIECEIRNEYQWPLFPGAAFYPELWVVRDDRVGDAIELMRTWNVAAPSGGPDRR